ncbi:substrate-binding domain-containing protein [Streptacidiphilus sp. MAP5-52]|uniref:substrate-binding domain-containing protein n=1 Tax=Streptacidiphilus sp. MAP5-52 TaxID=3156267 RepID=UPI0035173B96
MTDRPDRLLKRTAIECPSSIMVIAVVRLIRSFLSTVPIGRADLRYTVDERHERIIELVGEAGMMRVAELARLLDISPVTARRDVESLASLGRLDRTRGAVTLGPVQGPAEQAPGGPGPAFEPDPQVSSAPAGTVIGMVIPDPQHYFSDVIRGAREAVDELGGRLVLGFSGYDPEQDTSRAERMLESGVHGLLLTPGWMTGDGNEAFQLKDFGVPTVLVERRAAVGTHAAGLDWVCSDHRDGAGLAVAHLVSLGHKRIGLVCGISPLAIQLAEGYQAALRSFGLERPPLQTQELYAGAIDHDRLDEAGDRIAAAVAIGEVTAVLVLSDADAIILLESLRTRHPHIRVPDDLSIVAYDDQVAALSDLPLTAVAPPKYDVGRTAVRVLHQRLKEQQSGVHELPHRHTELLPELRVRASSGRAPQRTARGGDAQP